MEFIFELIGELIIEGATNKKVPFPIRCLLTFIITIFCLFITIGLSYLAFGSSDMYLLKILVIAIDILFLVFLLKLFKKFKIINKEQINKK